MSEHALLPKIRYSVYLLLGFLPTLAQSAEPPRFAEDVVPLLRAYCLKCHSSQRQAGGLSLARFGDEAAARNQSHTWERVLGQLRSGDMPPAGAAQPTPAERERLVRWIEQRVLPPRAATALRRLNRTEYAHTLRDLLGVDLAAANELPADEIGHGFDTIADLLTLSPLHFEKYLAVADRAVSAAFRSPATRDRILICRPTRRTHTECTARVLERFATRAFRRPVAREEIDRLVGLVQQTEAEGESWERGIQVALQAILVSPHFLFRVEAGTTPGEYVLASRLSYFLWSSMPDDELFDLAARNQLQATLDAQTRRMLKDPRAIALVENFAGQWLQLRRLADAAPDPKRFPGFDTELRAAMRRETELFVQAVMREDRSVLDFLDADFSFLNERLAKHYGIKGVQGSEFRRVSLPDRDRGGVVTHASVLTLTSNPTRTSPVKRGKWILENLLGAPPPSPPPEVSDLPDDRGGEVSGTLRQRLEQHRSNPTCASCHQRLDPLGFALENFDGVGRWRTRDGGLPVDASGALPGGAPFSGPQGLKDVLKARRGEFVHALAEKLLIYATGRGLTPADRSVLAKLEERLAAEDWKFSSLVLAIVRSEPFLGQLGGGKMR